MYVCLSVCAIFIYVEVEVRGQHLVLFSGTTPLFFLLYFRDGASCCSYWVLGFHGFSQADGPAIPGAIPVSTS